MAKQRFNVRYILYVPDWDTRAATDKGFADSITAQGGADSVQNISVFQGGLGNRANQTEFAIIPWVTDVRWHRTPPTTVTMTDGGYVTERTDRFMPGDVTISGDIDKVPYRFVQKLQTVNADSKPGASSDPLYNFPPAFRILSAAIALVRDVIRTPGVTLHLYSVDEGKYYAVEPLGEAQVRGGRNRVGLHYEFSFKVLDAVEPPKINATKDALPAASRKDWRRVITDEVDKVKNGMDAAMESIRQNMSDMEALTLRLTTLEDVTDALTSIADMTRFVTHSPARFEAAFVGATGKVLQAFADIRMAVTGVKLTASSAPRSPGNGASLVPSLIPDAGKAARDAEAYLAAAESAFYTAAAAARLGALEGRSTTSPHVVSRGESLNQIALNLLGDASRAMELATLNGLRAPFVSSSRIPNTVGPGDKIMVPATAPGVTGTLAESTVSVDERIYGRGVRLAPDGDWKVASDGRGVDTVAGVPCVEQGLRVRFDTVRGTNPVFPGVGLPEVLGEELDEVRRYTLGIDGLWQLRRDDRVNTVKEFALADGGNKIGINATVLLQNKESVALAT